jgi:hypothetical protein
MSGLLLASARRSQNPMRAPVAGRPHRASLLPLLALAGLLFSSNATGADAGTGPVGDSVGLGYLGTTCTCPSSENSNGAGEGRGVGGLGPPRAVPAEIWFDSIEVRGTLDREIIRRIAQRHRPELLACYEPVVARRRHFVGKLTIEFTIGLSGDVRAAAPRRSTVRGAPTVRDARVASCFVEAIRTWQFPHPHGQEVVVSERFTLVPPHQSDASWTGGKRR